MRLMDGTGDDLDMTEPAPTSHRRAAKAHVGELARPRFVDGLRGDFRLVLLSVAFPLAFVTGGLRLAAFEESASAVQRTGGVAMALLGMLVLASYALQFTTVLVGDAWTKSYARIATRLVLRFSWHTYLSLFGVVAMYEFVTWLIHR